MDRSGNKVGPDDEEEDIQLPDIDREDDSDGTESMRRNHPGHSDESYRAGRFLRVDFPYVPGDPFW